MSDQRRDNGDAETKGSDDYVKGGKGDASGDAEVRSEGELARQSGPRPKHEGQAAQKIDQSSGSE